MGRYYDMINNVNLSQINFNGLSTSENWVGYFQWAGFLNKEHNSKYSVDLFHKAGLLFYEYFKDCWNDFFLVSACAYDDNSKNEKDIDKIYGNTYEISKKNSLLKPYSETYDYWFSNKDIPLLAEFLTFCFDKDFILPFSEMVMAMTFRKVVGQQCFLINPKLQIALYPHEDIGYGCIDLGDNPKILTDFLNYCDKSKDFVSHIEEQYR